MNILIDDFDLNDLSDLGDFNFIRSFIKHEALRLLDFSYKPVAIRYFLKRKATVFLGGSSHQSIFFCKFGFISLKQSDNCTAEFFAVFGNLLTGDRTVNELVFNRLAVIDCNLNSCGILSRIAESKRILAVGKDIMLIGCKLLYIVASERKVGFDNSLAVLGKRDNLNQTVCRDRSTACRNKFLGGEKSETDILHFIAFADIEDVVLLDSLFKTYRNLLSLVYEAGCSFRHGDFLTCVGKLDLVCFLVNNHTLRCGNFNYRISAEVKLLTLGKSVFICGNSIYDLALCITECTVGSDNIFCCANLINCTCKTFHFIDRLINHIGVFHAGDIYP